MVSMKQKNATNISHIKNSICSDTITNTAIGLISYDRSGIIVSINENAATILGLNKGLPEASPVGKPLTDFIINTTPEKLFEKFLMSASAVRDFQYSFETVDGEKKWLLHDSDLFIDPVSGEEFTQMLIRDITSIKASGINNFNDYNKAAIENITALEKNIMTVQAIADITHDGIYIEDNHGRIIYWNDAAQKLFGYTKSDAIGKQLYKKLTPERFYRSHSKMMEEFTQTGNFPLDGTTREYRAIRKNGVEVPVEISFSTIKQKGRGTRIIGVVRDISKRKKTEKALLEGHQEKLRAITDSAHDAITLTDSTGKLTYWNRAAEKIFGYSKEEALGEKHYNLLLPAGTRDEFKSSMTTFSEMGKSPMFGKTVELVAVKKSGVEFPIELSSSTIKVHGEWSAVCIIRDITLRKRVEEDIKKSLQHQLVLDSLLHISLENTSLNELLQHSLDKILSIPWLNIMSKGSIFLTKEGTDSLEVKAHIGLTDEILEKCSTIQFGECLCGMAAATGKIKFTGSVTPEHSIIYNGMLPHGHYNIPILTNNKVIGIINLYVKEGHNYSAQEVAFLESVSKTLASMIKRKKMEEEKEKLWDQLLQSQKLESVGRLAGGMAHDFNNILTGIIGYGELAYSDLPEDHPVRKNLKVIIDSGVKAAKLVKQILAFSRKQILEMQKNDLNSIIDSMSKMLVRVIGEDVKLQTSFKAPAKAVLVDATQIEQVLLNLAVNARYAMPNGGWLTIETNSVNVGDEFAQHHDGAKTGEHIVITVTDTGSGMSNEIREKVFEPCFTTKEKGRGTGLGLSTAFGIIKQHNGIITVDSQLGEGTTFRIYIPVIDGSIIKKEKSEKKKQAIKVKGNETVLVVDDNTTTRSMIVETLKKHGYKLLEAVNGEEGLSISDQFDGNIDVMITDVIMTGINGWELYREMIKRRPAIKTIFTSGYIDNPIVKNSILENKHQFMRKPLHTKSLLDELQKALKKDFSGDNDL